MKTSLRSLSLLLLSAFATLSTHAATLAWDPTNTPGGTVSVPTGSGGAGAWNTSGLLWSNSTGDVAWNNLNNDSASLGGAGATITLNEAITVNNISFDNASGSYTIAGTGANTLTINGTIGGSSGSITAQILGANLTKIGGGSLTLNTAANAYTGNTLIQGGSLIARNNSSLPTTTTVTLGNSTTSGTLAIRTTTVTVAGIGTSGTGTANKIQSDANNTVNSTVTLVVNPSGATSPADSTFSGTLVNGGTSLDRFLALTKAGSNTLTLTGANTFTGVATVSAGTLATGSTGTFGAGNVSVAAGAALTFGNNASIGDLKTLTFASTSAIALNFTGAESVGSVFNSVTSTFLADGTYDAAGLNSFFGGISAFSGSGSLTVSAIPEPSTFALLAGMTALGLGAVRRRTIRA